MGCAVAWQEHGGEWQHLATHLGSNKEAYDAELHAIGDALEVAASREPGIQVTIFTDAQAALQRIKHDDPRPSQWLARRYTSGRGTLLRGTNAEYRRMPGHKGMPGNEAADRAAGQAAQGISARGVLRQGPAHLTSLAHLRRRVTEEKWEDSYKWITQMSGDRIAYKSPASKVQKSDPNPAHSRKTLAGCSIS